MSTTSDIRRRRRPSSRRTVKLITGITICTLSTLLFSLTLTATVITLVIATPLLLLFSPVLLPALLATVFVTAGFLVSGGCGMAAAATLGWLYSYVAGMGPPGSWELEKIVEKVKEVKDMAMYYITNTNHHHHVDLDDEDQSGKSDYGNYQPNGGTDHHYDYHPSSSSSY
ncbi:Oleosin L [Linum perenne]